METTLIYAYADTEHKRKALESSIDPERLGTFSQIASLDDASLDAYVSKYNPEL